MKKILFSILAIFMGSIMVFTPVFATCPEGTTPVSILDNVGNTVISEDGEKCVEDENGSTIMNILKAVVDIMSVGIGILGVIGISVSGVQYLTAGGNEEQTRKAKRRIFEIVLGLIVYVMIYTILVWLLPGFNGIN